MFDIKMLTFHGSYRNIFLQKISMTQRRGNFEIARHNLITVNVFLFCSSVLNYRQHFSPVPNTHLATSLQFEQWSQHILLMMRSFSANISSSSAFPSYMFTFFLSLYQHHLQFYPLFPPLSSPPPHFVYFFFLFLYFYVVEIFTSLM